MNNGFGLSQETIQKTQTALASFSQIQTAILYGSRAKGNYTNGSDIDLTFKVESHDEAKISLTDIGVALDELDLPYSFDLSIYSKINNPDLHAHIDRVGVVFYIKYS